PAERPERRGWPGRPAALWPAALAWAMALTARTPWRSRSTGSCRRPLVRLRAPGWRSVVRLPIPRHLGTPLATVNAKWAAPPPSRPRPRTELPEWRGATPVRHGVWTIWRSHAAPDYAHAKVAATRMTPRPPPGREPPRATASPPAEPTRP